MPFQEFSIVVENGCPAAIPDCMGKVIVVLGVVSNDAMTKVPRKPPEAGVIPAAAAFLLKDDLR